MKGKKMGMQVDAGIQTTTALCKQQQTGLQHPFTVCVCVCVCVSSPARHPHITERETHTMPGDAINTRLSTRQHKHGGGGLCVRLSVCVRGCVCACVGFAAPARIEQKKKWMLQHRGKPSARTGERAERPQVKVWHFLKVQMAPKCEKKKKKKKKNGKGDEITDSGRQNRGAASCLAPRASAVWEK